MPPRATNKEKRGPETWNPKKKNNSTADSQKEEECLQRTCSISRSRYPPGPDAATAVAEEFFNLPGTNCNDKRASPSQQHPPSVHVPESADTVAEQEVTTPVRNDLEYPGGASNTPNIPTFHDKFDEYDELYHNKYNYLSESVPAGATEHGKRGEENYDVAEKFLDQTRTVSKRHRSRDFSGSPHLRRRRSRSCRRYSSSDSYEIDRKRRRSHRSRSRRRRSRRSSSLSTSRSSSDRGRRRGGKESRAYDGRSRESYDRPPRHASQFKAQDSDFLEDGTTYSRIRSPAIPCRDAADVPSPSSRGIELRNPINIQPRDTEVPEYGTPDQGQNGTGRGACTLHSFNLQKESAERKDRRDRHKLREETANKRVEAGKKRYYVHINEDGQPYGHGVGLWNEAVGKLVRGLDPSYIDIRHQPFHLMDTMITRLNADFDYSHNVNSAWLRRRIGSALSSYRHELMKIIDAKGDRPQWVSEEIWSRLVTMSNSELHKTKSEQMKHANACRITKGRTGPIGVAGVTERLRLRLGRSPDPEEIQEEVTRDKSQDRRPRKKILEPAGRDAVIIPSFSGGEYITSTPSFSAAASTEVMPDPPSYADGADTSGNGRSSSASERQSDSVYAAIDIAFAREHTLGKVLLKQMEELRSIKDCETPELQLVLDGIMSQIRSLRKASESASKGSRAASPILPDRTPNCSSDPLEQLPTECTDVETLRRSSISTPRTVSPAPPDLPDAAIPTRSAPCAIQRKSGRKPKPKNRDI